MGNESDDHGARLHRVPERLFGSATGLQRVAAEAHSGTGAEALAGIERGRDALIRARLLFIFTPTLFIENPQMIDTIEEVVSEVLAAPAPAEKDMLLHVTAASE